MSLERIEITPFAVIAGDILRQRLTGSLTIIDSSLRRVLYWSQGDLVLITSAAEEDSLGQFLVRRGIVPPDRAAGIVGSDPEWAVARFHEAGMLELSWRQTLLREWVAGQFIPLFSLIEGNAVFTEDAAIEPERRVFLQSTAALVLEGVRSIANGLVLRRSLGDLKRQIEPSRTSRFDIDTIPLTDTERAIAQSLHAPQSIERFLRHLTTESVTAARVVIGMIALGIYEPVEGRATAAAVADGDDMQRDLEMLAAIGSDDQRSLRAFALSRQFPSMDHYQVLDVPRAATRAQITTQAEEKKKKFDPATYPPAVRDAVIAINRRIEEAHRILKETSSRASYDKLLHEGHSGGDASEAKFQQRLTQQSIAQQNLNKGRELMTMGDYYGAIVLLKQSVHFVSDNAEAWHLLGSCQERNPMWRREAVESFQNALSVDPNYVESMISLGDIYRAEGMASRAQACFEDALRISPDNAQAKSRLTAMKKK